MGRRATTHHTTIIALGVSAFLGVMTCTKPGRKNASVMQERKRKMLSFCKRDFVNNSSTLHSNCLLLLRLHDRYLLLPFWTWLLSKEFFLLLLSFGFWRALRRWCLQNTRNLNRFQEIKNCAAGESPWSRCCLVLHAEYLVHSLLLQSTLTTVAAKRIGKTEIKMARSNTLLHVSWRHNYKKSRRWTQLPVRYVNVAREGFIHFGIVG